VGTGEHDDLGGGVSKDEAVATLTQSLEDLKAACCIDGDEGGTYYAPDCEEDIAALEEIIDTVRRLHTTDEVAEWIRWNTGPGFDFDADVRWREEVES
jgi:hypothetical protein